MNAPDALMDTPHPLRERVELIIHLLKFSDRLFAIMSPASSELQTFADLLLENGGTGLIFARVRPEPTLSTEDIATDLAKAWDIELNLGEAATQAIEQRLPSRLLKPRRAVAIIEDAEHLPPQTLDAFIDFMQRLDELTGGRVRLALLGSPALLGRLQHMPSLEGSGQIYALHLTPPPAESFAEVANRLLEDSSPAFERPAPPPGEPSSALPSRTLLIGGIAISLTLAIVMALLMRPSEPEAKKDQQVSLPLKNETLASLPVAPLPPATPEAVTDKTAAPVISPPIGHQLSDSPPSLPSANATMPPMPSASEGRSSAMPAGAGTGAAPLERPRPDTPSAPPPANLAMPSGSGVKPAAPLASTEPKTNTTTARTAEAKPSASTPKAEAPSAKKTSNWYAQQKAEQYVLQVVSLKSAAEVDRFIKQNALKDCHSFRQVRDGQTLHTVTCGLYPSREEARQAMAKLPEKLRATKPFPRRIDDIRKIMQP